MKLQTSGVLGTSYAIAKLAPKRVKISEKVDFLKSNTINIDDWNNSKIIFEGGEIQYFNPKVNYTEITILK